MKNSKFKIQNFRLLFGILFFAFGVSLINAQSTNQNFPTAVTSNEVSGTIKARDIGDARLTSYFYVFNGTQGDIFINVVTKNLDGDIDVFTADNLRPLTKIRVYSDNPDSETGRVIYLRLPQKLILRIEGRTPTDDPASFRIKFAGSFAPSEAVAETDESKQPEIKRTEKTDVEVNSVGTIISVKPKPTPTPKPTVAKVEKPKKVDEETEKPEKAKKQEPERDDAEREEKKSEAVVTENIPENKEETAPETKEPKKKPAPRRPAKPKAEQPETAKTETTPKKPAEKKSSVAPVEPAMLENIRLVIEFKDGTRIERPMSEVLKFSVDKGILTVITKDGKIERFSILDVSKMAIQ